MWTPATVKPKKDDDYLVTIDNAENGIYEDVAHYYVGRGWDAETCNYTVYDLRVTAWMELPEPYKENE